MTTNILVVDDSLSMRTLISGIIEGIGYKAFQASSGEAAIEIFETHPIDLVVLDVEMPGMNGFETCKELRAHKKNDWFPVIYLSGTASDEYIVKGLEAGGDTYVSKPVNARVLESIIKAMGRITDMKQALQEANTTLEKLAHYDGLTKILNRRGFDQALERYWRQAMREHTELSCILLDVDHFKLFNDHYGHLEGDDCLKSIASTLEQQLHRPIDLAARYGGEEFAVLLPVTGREGAEHVAQRLLESIRNLKIAHASSKSAAFVTASMGIATSSDCESSAELLKKADTALYKAKEGGRNRFEV